MFGHGWWSHQEGDHSYFFSVRRMPKSCMCMCVFLCKCKSRSTQSDVWKWNNDNDHKLELNYCLEREKEENLTIVSKANFEAHRYPHKSHNCTTNWLDSWSSVVIIGHPMVSKGVTDILIDYFERLKSWPGETTISRPTHGQSQAVKQ